MLSGLQLDDSAGLQPVYPVGQRQAGRAVRAARAGLSDNGIDGRRADTRITTACTHFAPHSGVSSRGARRRSRDRRRAACRSTSRASRVTKPVAGHYAKDILFPNADVSPQDIDVTGSYDAFTFTTMLQLEDYGFCKKGDGPQYVSDGTMRLGGRRPNNTSGGHLCEGYTHGIAMVIENVRQLRHDVDDSCPIGPDGRRQHTHDYRKGGCRQVKDAELSANLGWAMPGTGSAMIMRRG